MRRLLLASFFMSAALSACGSSPENSQVQGDDPQFKRLVWQGDTTQRNCFGHDPVNQSAVVRACATQGNADALFIKDMSTKQPWQPGAMNRVQISRNSKPAQYLTHAPNSRASAFVWDSAINEHYVLEKNEGLYRIRLWRLVKPGTTAPDLCIVADRARRLTTAACNDTTSHIWKLEDFFN